MQKNTGNILISRVKNIHAVGPQVRPVQHPGISQEGHSSVYVCALLVFNGKTLEIWHIHVNQLFFALRVCTQSLTTLQESNV